VSHWSCFSVLHGHVPICHMGGVVSVSHMSTVTVSHESCVSVSHESCVIVSHWSCVSVSHGSWVSSVVGRCRKTTMSVYGEVLYTMITFEVLMLVVTDDRQLA